jgi:glutamine synthetase adenylyltransferase
MFYSNPNLLNLVAEIMGTAPRLAEVLSRSPNRLDAVLTPGFFEHLPARHELAEELDLLLRPARDFEDVLNIARRWTNDQIFRAGVHILRNITDGEHCGPFLSDVADLALAAMEPRVTDEFARRHGRFDGFSVAIVALGKLGSRQMTMRSDPPLRGRHAPASQRQRRPAGDQPGGVRPLSAQRCLDVGAHGPDPRPRDPRPARSGGPAGCRGARGADPAA